MSKLLDLEQQAEVESAENSLDAEAPSARDRVLPHLRLSDVETGLLGRSLLTLVNNKVVVLYALKWGLMCDRTGNSDERQLWRGDQMDFLHPFPCFILSK